MAPTRGEKEGRKLRYRKENCGDLQISEFQRALHAEGLPVRRIYVATISGQTVMRKLAERRPEYIRVLPTPVADEAVTDTVYIPQGVFLGAAHDMVDIATAIKKVEAYFIRVAARILQPLATMTT